MRGCGMTEAVLFPKSMLGKCLASRLTESGDALIALASYFDSSGDAADQFMTLAGVAADDSAWSSIENHWREILRNRIPQAEYMHMWEAHARRKGFDTAKGWTETLVVMLIWDLIRDCLQTLDKKRFRLFSCTVDMNAYRKLKALTYKLDHPIDICNRYCSGIVLAWYVLKYPDVIHSAHYFFDQGERFKGKFENEWRNENARARKLKHFTWRSVIKTITTADMKETPALQIADMFAWATNRENTTKDGEKWHHLAHIMRQVIPSSTKVWREEDLRRE